jgi:hypothetical protein
MKRHTDGQGDKQIAITLCGVNLLCKDLSFYFSINKLSTKVPLHAHRTYNGLLLKNFSIDQLSPFQMLSKSGMNSLFIHIHFGTKKMASL